LTCAAWRAGRSGSISAISTDNSRWLPRRKTVSVARLPGLVLPTIRGRSEDRSMVRPSNLMMMSPASTPAFSAGAPASTLRTKAPWGRPRPMDSATSLVTWSMDTPMRPRLTRPVGPRSWSATRIASSIGIANEMPMKPPERE
jgi:hypothetical protein